MSEIEKRLTKLENLYSKLFESMRRIDEDVKYVTKEMEKLRARNELDDRVSRELLEEMNAVFGDGKNSEESHGDIIQRGS